MDKIKAEPMPLQKVAVRLPPEVIEAMDLSIKNGLAENRSEIIRKAVEAIRNLAGPNGPMFLHFLTQVIHDPMEVWLWYYYKARLFMLGDQEQRLYAGRMTYLFKTMGRTMGIEERIDYGEMRQRILDAISTFRELEHSSDVDGLENFSGDLSKIRAAQALLKIPSLSELVPPTGEPYLAEGFEIFINRLMQRIEAGATAKEVADKMHSLIYLAGVHDLYPSGDDVPGDFQMMAEACDIAGIFLEERRGTDAGLMAEAFESWVLTVPALYDNVELREEVKLLLLEDLDEAPKEENKTAEDISETRDQASFAYPLKKMH